jgi:hypothetical protein
MSLIKSKVKTVVKDFGFANAMAEIEFMAGKSFTQIGIQSDAPDPPNDPGISMAQLAAVQEFGSKKRNIPERSYIRSTMDEKRRTFNTFTDALSIRIIQGKITARNALKALGELIESSIKAKITNLREPALSPKTIAAKGSSNPLIDTGRLRSSIRHKPVLNKKAVRRAKIPKNGELKP